MSPDSEQIDGKAVKSMPANKSYSTGQHLSAFGLVSARTLTSKIEPSDSVLLSDILTAFSYLQKDEQIALTKLAAYRSCFDKEFKDKLISDEQANKLLNKSFSSLQEGVKWWVDITQKNWLRPSFNKEGLGKDKDIVINVVRWLEHDAETKDEESRQFLLMFKCLGLVDTINWPEEKVNDVVIHGGMTEHVQERIDFLQDFSGKLYYLTNRRGLFNQEPALAPILAAWFEKPEEEKTIASIQKVLDKYKDPTNTDKHWLKNLSSLKQEILEALGKKEWPKGKGWYYKDSESFDSEARSIGRESLAGWPTAMDMVEFFLKQKILKEPGKFDDITLIPVYSVREGRVANTNDTIQDWYKKYAANLSSDKTVVFVSNNSSGLHFIRYQDVILHHVLESYGASSKPLKVATVGPGSSKISLSAATDVLAKIFYTKREDVLNLVSIKNQEPVKSHQLMI